MKPTKRRKIVSAIVCLLGTVPFLTALVLGLFRSSMLSYSDFLILYSYLFWPTYIFGAILLIAGLLLRFGHIKPTHSDKKETSSCSTEK